MLFDFVINIYLVLLKALQQQGYSFQTFDEFLEKPKEKVVILRHDVDKSPGNSLRIAQLETSQGVKGVYYFRTLPCCYSEKIIRQVADLGHEVGYHYETMDTASRKLNMERIKLDDKQYGVLIDSAYVEFLRNLDEFRKIYPVKTICMHGSPLSKFDNREIWKKYDYRRLGIIGEQYFDVDFDEVLYLTDTGRSWNGDRFNSRDKELKTWDNEFRDEIYKDWEVKPVSRRLKNMVNGSKVFRNKFRFRLTSEIIRAVLNDELPNQIIINTHPQRWTDKAMPWTKELVWQNVKNVGKYFLVKIRN